MRTRDFYRILTHSGKAILLVPLFDLKTTYEDFSITTPEGRLEAFGQSDHVRKYGDDFIDRLKSVGFIAREVESSDFLDEHEIISMNARRKFFICEK
ncbi:MAG: hypothetical protein IBX45_08020 [Campylobacterales bacterium]|nr:hypothetical protein [Campylobacterales bacterium]